MSDVTGAEAVTGAPARELIESGFALENADAPLLHHGLNLADIAHVIDLRARRVVPEQAARQLLSLLLEVYATPAEAFPYDPSHGEAYNSREYYFASRLGDVAGWLHAGRPRREATRLALRLLLRRQLVELVEDAAGFADSVIGQATTHAETLMPDQTYLQQAQPSTFGHYVLSFAYPTLRDGRRLLDGLDWVNTSPGGAGCVNGSRLLEDRSVIADLLGFGGVIEHTRDAMWQVDGLINILATTASMLSNQSKLAEDLEIWSSGEFDYVDLDSGFTRSSVLMPQKRNPYSLSIVRGAHGILIGRLSGFLAVVKSPSARSDNLIFAYGEVPRALELACRVTRLMSGVVRTLHVNTSRMADALTSGFTQATDLAEHIVTVCRIDYRTAYMIVGRTVREAAAKGLRGVDINGEMLDNASVELEGRPLGLAGHDLSPVLDPRLIVLTRSAQGGAAPAAVEAMVQSCGAEAGALHAAAAGWTQSFAKAEATLLAAARQITETQEVGVMTVAVQLPDEVEVVNLGLPLFADAVRDQGRPVSHVDWRPPADGDPVLVAALSRLYGKRAAAIDEANAEVARRFDQGVPMLVGIEAAGVALPGVGERTIVHCGPRIEWDRVCDPLRRSVRAAVMAEGWADSPDAAEALLVAGDVSLEPANLHQAVVPMASAIGPSMPVFVVDNPQGGTRAYSAINQGPGEVAWFGRETPAAVERLVFLREVAGPLLAECLEQVGQIDVFGLASQGLQMGDDLHMRTQATTNLFVRALLPQLIGLEVPRRAELGRFLAANHLFFLNLAMAAAKSLTLWAEQVEGSSLVTTMSRNGTDYGIRLSGSDEWFITASPPVGNAMYYSGYGPEQSAPDIGDSAVLELIGLGGSAAAASPAVAAFVGGTMADAIATTEEVDRIAVARSTRLKLPTLDYRGTPMGIDVRKVVELGITPKVNTGILHATDGTGQVGAGVAEAPIACFREALLALDRRLA